MCSWTILASSLKTETSGFDSSGNGYMMALLRWVDKGFSLNEAHQKTVQQGLEGQTPKRVSSGPELKGGPSVMIAGVGTDDEFNKDRDKAAAIWKAKGATVLSANSKDEFLKHVTTASKLGARTTGDSLSMFLTGHGSEDGTFEFKDGSTINKEELANIKKQLDSKFDSKALVVDACYAEAIVA